ncbi:MAG: hypothetical protein RXO36_03905 [Candidatus Nanopusillus acidilobi]
MAKVSTETKLVGTMSVRSFLTDFSDFNYKANQYVEEIISNYLKMDIQMIGKKRATIFTYYDVYEDGTEREIDDTDLELKFVEKYEDGYKYEELVHWGLVNVKSNIERATFYVHYEDWNALYCYLSMLNDEYDVENVKFEIEDGDLIVNDDFKIRLYN